MAEQVNDPAKAELLKNESSVHALHQDAMQESADPEEAFDPGPRWFYYFAVATLTIAGFYLGRHMGEFGTQSHLGYINLGDQKAAAQNNASSSSPAGSSNSSVSGATVYNSRCAACHQPDGKGLPGAFPPLAGSPYVLGDASTVVRIILHGLHGAIQVNGQTYNGVMPAWEAQLSDAEIAAVATHIRGKLANNKANPVDEAAVATIRKDTSGRTTPWTVEELGTAEKQGSGEKQGTGEKQETPDKQGTAEKPDTEVAVAKRSASDHAVQVTRYVHNNLHSNHANIGNTHGYKSVAYKLSLNGSLP